MRLCILGCLVVSLLAPPPCAQAQGLLGRLSGPRAARELRSASPEERIEAARVLSRWGAQGRAVRVLSEALRAERDVSVRHAIVAALARRGDPAAVPVLIEALETAAGLDPATVLLALGAFRDPDAARAIVAVLGRDELREVALRALERLGPFAVPHLLLALEEPPLRVPALEALGRIGDLRATPALVSALGDAGEEVREAAATALGQLGDERAAPALGRRLSDESVPVVIAALAALERVGDPGRAAAVEAALAEGPPAQRRAALRALLHVDPPSAIARMERAVASGDEVLARTSVELALGSVDPRVVSLLYGLLLEGTYAAQAASALAEVDDGAGLRVLAQVASAEPGRAEAAVRALAVGLRKWEGRVDGAQRAEAWAVLRAAGEDPRGILLRSVARDPTVAPALRPGLSDRDPAVRATAARGLELLGDGRWAGAVAAALANEEDPEAYRRLASAAAHLGARLDAPALGPRLDTPEVGPEAAWLAALSQRGWSPSRRAELARALRIALRSEHPRVRAGAARALAAGDDRGAWRALLFALEDPAPEVRLAAARALEALAVPGARRGIRARWRVEEDPVVASALLDAAEAPEGRPRGLPERGAVSGSESVRVRIVAVGQEGRRGVPVDVVLPDGRWLRMRTLPSGELLLVDLPAGVADVRVRVGE